MTREETKELLMIMTATYPNLHIEDRTATINAWHMVLEDYSIKTIQAALKAYIKSGKAFAPSVGELIALINKPAELNELTEAEAWSMVSKAIRNSAYNSKAEYERFPEEVKKAVGDPQQLFIWATDENYNESVAMSLFQRNYKTVINRKHDYNMLPPELQLQVSNPLQIGVNDDRT